MFKDAFSPEEQYRFEKLIEGRDKLNTAFHTWMMFFVVIIGALFVGYHTLATRADALNAQQGLIAVTVFGYIVSLFWHFSCKGYHLWVRHWLSLIQEHEKILNENKRIYSMPPKENDKGCYCNPLSHANISTGRILNVFSFIMTLAWGFLFLLNIREIAPVHPLCIAGALLVATVVFCCCARGLRHRELK